MDNKKHVSILGCCVCRDLFEIPKTKCDENGGYVVDRFVQSINPIAAMHPPAGGGGARAT